MSFHLEKMKTEMTPYVLIDEENKYMRLEGESYPGNVIDFYKDISQWLGGFLNSDFTSFTFDCELRYFNSSSVKVLLNMLLDMDNSKNSKNITVNWITTKNNRIIIECGEDFQEDLHNLKFNLVMKEP